MPIEELLPQYKKSLEYIQRRISELQLKRRIAEKQRKWREADEYGNRIIALEDSANNLQDTIHEIERYGQ